MRVKQRWAKLGWFVVMVYLAGCQGNVKPKLAPVSGRVIFRDQGMTAADIYFMPDKSKGNEGSMASSVLQLDGSFTLSTHPYGTGVLPGTYKVTLAMGRKSAKELDKYRHVETSPLEYTVPPEGLTDLLIELK